MTTLDERWKAPGMECDLCKRAKRPEERWWDTHTNAGICGFTFNFCTECEKDRQAECDEVMANAISEHRRRSREYWETHPEELEQYKKEVEEYRRTQLNADGFPFDWKRPWWKLIWNWFCRAIGYKYGNWKSTRYN